MAQTAENIAMNGGIIQRRSSTYRHVMESAMRTSMDELVDLHTVWFERREMNEMKDDEPATSKLARAPA
jgi:hypothetical protein